MNDERIESERDKIQEEEPRTKVAEVQTVFRDGEA